MSTTPGPAPEPTAAPPPEPGPEPAPETSPAASTAVPELTEPGPPAASPPGRTGVPRWLLVTIIAVVVAAVAVVGFLTLFGGDDDESAPSQPLAADVTTISGGPLTFTSQVQWNLDNNGYIYRGSRCVFIDPAATFERGTMIVIDCFLIFVPDTVVLEGRDIVVVDGVLTIVDGAQPLDAPGCPDTGTTIELPPPGTPPGPPIACVRTDEGTGFAVFVTSVADVAPTLAVMRLP